jgi:2-dehydro-3-deoxygluconokinase
MGVGDAFTAGQLHAINAFGNDSQKILDYALAAATLKYSIVGDYNLATDEEIQTLMKG